MEQKSSSVGLNGRNNAAVTLETNEGGLWKGVKHIHISFYLSVITLALVNLSITGILEQIPS